MLISFSSKENGLNLTYQYLMKLSMCNMLTKKYPKFLTSRHSWTPTDIFFSILFLLAPNLIMPKFLRHVTINLRWSFQRSPSAQINPVTNKEYVTISLVMKCGAFHVGTKVTDISIIYDIEAQGVI
jgi:hypothetical protein